MVKLVALLSVILLSIAQSYAATYCPINISVDWRFRAGGGGWSPTHGGTRNIDIDQCVTNSGEDIEVYTDRWDVLSPGGSPVRQSIVNVSMPNSDDLAFVDGSNDYLETLLFDWKANDMSTQTIQGVFVGRRSNAKPKVEDLASAYRPDPSVKFKAYYGATVRNRPRISKIDEGDTTTREMSVEYESYYSTGVSERFIGRAVITYARIQAIPNIEIDQPVLVCVSSTNSCETSNTAFLSASYASGPVRGVLTATPNGPVTVDAVGATGITDGGSLLDGVTVNLDENKKGVKINYSIPKRTLGETSVSINLVLSIT